MDCRVRSLTRLRSNAVLESALHSDWADAGEKKRREAEAAKARSWQRDLDELVDRSTPQPRRAIACRVAELLRRGTLGKIRVRLQRRRGWKRCLRGRI
jgi:hypothetical protein